MNTSQHGLSSTQILLRLLLFLEFNLYIPPLIDRFVNLLVIFSWTGQILTSFPNFSGTKWNSGLDHGFHEKIHQLFSEGRREVHGDHRIVDPMLQTPPAKTCRQKRFERSANVFEVAPNRACTNRFVLSRRCPASHAEISESTNQVHIPQPHAHLQKTIVFEPTSCTNRQCISLDRFVVRLRWAH